MANFVAHFAIQADDLERARRFYERVFGWQFEPWGPPGFFRIHTGPASGSGITEGGLSARPTAGGGELPLNAYRCSISVESVADMERSIEENGGRALAPIVELPGVGKILAFADPEDNVVAAVEYEATGCRAVGAALVGEAGEVGEGEGEGEGEGSEGVRLYRVILPSQDIDRSVTFYRRLLAMDGERVSEGRHYFQCGGVILAVVDPRADGDDRDAHPNSDHVYLAAGALESYHARASELGALSSSIGEIETRPWGERSFYLEDPFGNPLCFVDESTLFLGRGQGQGGSS